MVLGSPVSFQVLRPKKSLGFLFCSFVSLCPKYPKSTHPVLQLEAQGLQQLPQLLHRALPGRGPVQRQPQTLRLSEDSIDGVVQLLQSKWKDPNDFKAQLRVHKLSFWGPCLSVGCSLKMPCLNSQPTSQRPSKASHPWLFRKHSQATLQRA